MTQQALPLCSSAKDEKSTHTTKKRRFLSLWTSVIPIDFCEDSGPADRSEDHEALLGLLAVLYALDSDVEFPGGGIWKRYQKDTLEPRS